MNEIAKRLHFNVTYKLVDDGQVNQGFSFSGAPAGDCWRFICYSMVLLTSMGTGMA